MEAMDLQFEHTSGWLCSLILFNWMDSSKVVLFMLIHLLLFYWAVSTSGAVVSEYANALKVVESSSWFLQATNVGHKLVGNAKYKTCVGLSHKHRQIYWCVLEKHN